MESNERIPPVELLRRQYSQCLDPENLALPKPEILRLPETQKRIYEDLFDESRLKYPPPERYRFRVLKKILAALEEAIEDPEEDEISNDISECMAQYMAHPLPSASAAAQQKHYVTYTAPTTDPYPISVTLLEAPALLASSGTTGFRTWEASLYLASFFVSAEGKRYIKGRNVLELGAGTGFLSILCATHLDARSVLATDGSEEVVNDLRVNMALNRVEGNENVKVNYLQWGQTLIGGVADCRKQGQEYELVIGADVTYDVQSIPALVATLRDLFELYPKIKVVISATVRNEHTLAAFLNACDANDFTREKLAFNGQEMSEQIGFFHPTSTPIDIFLITYEGQMKDPFSL